MTPLFVPLKREFFEAFAAGTKTREFRKYGPRWNERTCRRGRPVVLSMGYGKAHRLRGRVGTLTIGPASAVRPREAWEACYGPAKPGDRFIAIRIHLEGKA